jgi:hypothetical protein
VGGGKAGGGGGGSGRVPVRILVLGCVYRALRSMQDCSSADEQRLIGALLSTSIPKAVESSSLCFVDGAPLPEIDVGEPDVGPSKGTGAKTGGRSRYRVCIGRVCKLSMYAFRMCICIRTRALWLRVRMLTHEHHAGTHGQRRCGRCPSLKRRSWRQCPY